MTSGTSPSTGRSGANGTLATNLCRCASSQPNAACRTCMRLIQSQRAPELELTPNLRLAVDQLHANFQNRVLSSAGRGLKFVRATHFYRPHGPTTKTGNRSPAAPPNASALLILRQPAPKRRRRDTARYGSDKSGCCNGKAPQLLQHLGPGCAFLRPW